MSSQDRPAGYQPAIRLRVSQDHPDDDEADEEELPDLPSLGSCDGGDNLGMEGDKSVKEIQQDGRLSNKRRRIHLGLSECLEHQQSAEGALPLTNPAAVAKSSKDPHRGLYPRGSVQGPALPHSSQSLGFVSARTLHQGPMAGLPASQSSASPVKSETSPRKRSPGKRKTPLSNQNNSMFDYFKKSNKPSAAGSADALSPCGGPEPGCSQSSQESMSQCCSQCCSQDSSISQCSTQCCSQCTCDSNTKLGSGGDLPGLRSKPGKAPPLPSLAGFSSQIISIDSGSDCSSSSDIFDSIMKSKGTKTKSTKSTRKKTNTKNAKKNMKKVPTFNRDNPFLYDNGPVSPTTSASISRALSQSDVKDKYGLLGTGTEPPEEEEEWIADLSHLPEEVLELILCQLPLLDLVLNVNRVCTRWNNIISHENVSLLFCRTICKLLMLKFHNVNVYRWVSARKT